MSLLAVQAQQEADWQVATAPRDSPLRFGVEVIVPVTRLGILHLAGGMGRIASTR